jgi:hypothetical protein
MLNNLKQKSKKDGGVKHKDSPPSARITVKQDRSPDAVLPAITPVLVLQK